MMLRNERMELIAKARQGALTAEEQGRLADDLEEHVAEGVKLVGHIHEATKMLEAVMA